MVGLLTNTLCLCGHFVRLRKRPSKSFLCFFAFDLVPLDAFVFSVIISHVMDAQAKVKADVSNLFVSHEKKFEINRVSRMFRPLK